MAEQISRRAQNVTDAKFEGAFETQTVRFGSGTLNLKESLDTLEGWARHTNIWHAVEGEATARPGQTSLATFPAGARTRSTRIQLPPAAAFWEATRSRRGLPPRPSMRAGVNGWFPHINSAGRIVSGSGEIWVDGVYLDTGWAPKWINEQTIVYNHGSATRMRDVVTGGYGDVGPAANTYAGDASGGGAWQALIQTGAITMLRYTGLSTLAATYTGRGSPAIAPNGDWGNSDNYFGTTRSAYRNATAIASGLQILDVSLSTTHSCLCIATGTYTRSVKVYPGGTENAIQSYEAPLIIDGPLGAPWILSLWQTGLILRPAGSHVGYHWTGEWFNPWARYVGDHFVIAASTGAGVPKVVTVDPDDPRIDLITFGPGPGPDPSPDPGPDPGPIGVGTRCHSIRKLRDPEANAVTRVWGVDTTLRIGLSGAVDPIDSGYSGDPLTLLPHRPPLSGDPWMFVADRSRMRKVRADGLDIPIGLPAPNAPSTFLDPEFSREIAMFDDTDGTPPGSWLPAPGKDDDGVVVGAPDAPTATEGPIAGFGMYAVTNPGAHEGGYDSWWGYYFDTPRDLTTLQQVGGGPTVVCTDDDICHIWMKLAQPQNCAELRVYVVVSETFDHLILPGTAETGANTDAYVKAFRPNDYTPFIQAQTEQIVAAEQARVYALRDADSKSRGFNDTRAIWEEERAAADPARARSFQIGTGSHQWFGYGAIGSAFRRGDFQRIGSTPGRNWGTVTGLIVYVRVIADSSPVNLGIGWDDWYFTGGFGPDTTEAGAQAYDYRITHYDPRTGAESNGSEEQPEFAKLDPVRRHIRVDPPGYGDSAVRQRIYRRGGSLIDDWYFVGENSADGASFVDELSDSEIVAAGILPTDHYQPVPTIDDEGHTILAQPLPALWGPVEGMLMGCGDPHRPGHVYFCVGGQPDHWSANGNVEVCAPSEELMHGGLAGHQAFVFSRSRLYLLYPNLSGQGDAVTATPALCTRGLLGRWSFCSGPGGMIYFVAEDGVYATQGGPEEWLSEAINPLFYGTAAHGYAPIDKTAVTALRLTCWEQDLYFQYQDTGGSRHVLVFSILTKAWRYYDFAKQPAVVQGEDEDILLLGGNTTGAAYTLSGTSDAGTAIDCAIRTGSASAGRREEKLFGDIFLDANPGGTPLDLQVYLNEETHINLPSAVAAGVAARQRYLIDAFGLNPQKAHSIACELRWSSAGAPPIIYQLGYAITLQPDITNKRVTNWDDLNSPDEVWLTGVTFDCDTGGQDKTILVERDFGGVRDVVASCLVNSANRHKFKFSWLAVPANMVRLRPADGDCATWLLYRADWIYVQEPPRISKWDIHFENQWDQYYTGLDLYCDTGGAEKIIEVWVDEVRLSHPQTGEPFWRVTANGRSTVHLTLPWGRGHVFRFLATDNNAGLLYTHRWHLQAEPSEQTNWNQNFSILGTRADKWLKAVIFECDTYGADKTVQVEVDGTVVETLVVNTTGRRVVQLALQTQHLGRVWRLFPVDAHPGRLYSAEPLFDEEPFALNRWETQETNHGLPGWFYPLYAHITVKSTADVTLTTVVQHNQVGGTTTHAYAIPATGGQKQRRFLNGFHAVKGVLIKYVLTSPAPFWLYRDETTLVIQPWGAQRAITVQPFGNDDLDPSRPMTHAVLAAQASGGVPDGGG